MKVFIKMLLAWMIIMLMLAFLFMLWNMDGQQFYGLPILIGVVLSVIAYVFYAKAVKNNEMEKNAGIGELSGIFGGNETNNLLEYLRSRITDKMSLEDIVDVFEQMCTIPMDDDMILFETGTFSFAGEPLFHFSLVRQFPNDEEEYYQIHVEVLYKPTSKNSVFQEATWNEDLRESIFDYIRKSQAFDYAKHDEYMKINIFMDET